MQNTSQLKKFSSKQIDAYLKRIGYNGDCSVSKKTLDDLIWHHQLHIPFETLDCHDFNKEISLDPDAMFDKIVNRHRGGHCIETNSNFCRLLNSLGFDARPCLARVLFGNGEFSHPFDHRPNLVSLNGRTYFCDVGIGGPMPSAAMDIDISGWQNLRADSYAVRPALTKGWYDLLRQTNRFPENPDAPDAFSLEMIFSTIHSYESDFVFLNYYMTHHPEALHKSTRIVNIRTADGFRMIWNDTYKESRNGELVIEQSVEGNLEQLLMEKFAIDLSDDPAWISHRDRI